MIEISLEEALNLVKTARAISFTEASDFFDALCKEFVEPNIIELVKQDND